MNKLGTVGTCNMNERTDFISYEEYNSGSSIHMLWSTNKR